MVRKSNNQDFMGTCIKYQAESFENSEHIQVDDVVSSRYAKVSHSTVAKVQPGKEAK